MAIVWDERKKARNLKKHQVSFDEAATVFDDPFFVVAKDEDHSIEESGLLSWENPTGEGCWSLPMRNEEKIGE